jgi:hypothetical protein
VKYTLKTQATSALVVAALALPLAARAQEQAQPAPTTAPAVTTGQATGKAAAHVEQRITELHKQLRITPAQDAQWQQFAQVMRDNARNMDQLMEQRASKVSTMTAPEDLQFYADVSAQHAQDIQKLTVAFQTLYTSFPDDQKKTADVVFRQSAEHGRHQKNG